MVVTILFTSSNFVFATSQGFSSIYFFPQEKKKVVNFEESYNYIVNPYMGSVAAANRKDRAVDGSLVLGIYTWKDLESQKGKYSYEKLEKSNNYNYWINEKKNNYMFIFVMDDPGLVSHVGYNEMDIPMWLYNELKNEAEQKYKQLLKNKILTPNERREYEIALWKIQNDKAVIDEFNRNWSYLADIPDVGTFYRYPVPIPGGKEYRGGFSPNYKSELILKYHGEVLKSLAKRYDNEKTYAVVMGSLGHWGEMHTFHISNKDHFGNQFGNQLSSGRYPSKDIAYRYEMDYSKYFKNVVVSVRYPREVAKQNNFGLHSHAFGEQRLMNEYMKQYEKGYLDESTGDFHPAMKDFWKTAPSGGEFYYTGDARYLSNQMIEETIKQARDTHITWFNERGYELNEEERKNQMYFYSKIGYRFVPLNVSYSSLIGSSKKLKIDSVWKNAGTAPFYKDWKLKAVLIDKNGNIAASKEFEKSIKELLPGDNLTQRYQTIMDIPKTVKRGKYKLYIGIYNNISQKPEIKFAVTAKDQNGLYLLGEVTIL